MHFVLQGDNEIAVNQVFNDIRVSSEYFEINTKVQQESTA